MKFISKIFHEEALGVLMIIMMTVASIYVFTESIIVQKIGFSLTIVLIFLGIGYIVKSVIEGITWVIQAIVKR